MFPTKKPDTTLTVTKPQAAKPKNLNSVLIRGKRLFSTVSLLALGPAQLPNQQGPGSHSDAVKQLASETTQSPPYSGTQCLESHPNISANHYVICN
jgi:hypothetical protein